jgi:hypothetical protein
MGFNAISLKEKRPGHCDCVAVPVSRDVIADSTPAAKNFELEVG